MPQLGVGTSTLKETAAECVKRAIGLGYRLVDAAQGYDNEAEVWYGIKESGIGRSEVFIISKVSPDAVRSGKVRESLDRTIEAFGGTYVDLMLIHWPDVNTDFAETALPRRGRPGHRGEQLQSASRGRIAGIRSYQACRQPDQDSSLHGTSGGRGQHFCQRYSSSVMAPLGQGKINEIYDD